MGRAPPDARPAAGTRRVLASGAWLKNAACLLTVPPHGPWTVQWSALHGDLSTPEACEALGDSLAGLVAAAGGRIDAVAHDLHPDFHSTRLAIDWADRLGVPAIGVQHHRAHVAVVQAEAANDSPCDDHDGDATRPVIGIALDGVGLGIDGSAWGGELLLIEPGREPDWRRIGHLAPIALAGGDIAAREPWRLAAAVLVRLDRADEVAARFAPAVDPTLARGVTTLLQRGLHAPPSTSAGRWFDAAAAALGLHPRQAHEAEAAMALEALADSPAGRAAQAHLDPRPLPVATDNGTSVIDLYPTVAALFDHQDAHAAGDPSARAQGAARFHMALADGLAAAAIRAARAADAGTVMLGGGCFLNQVLSRLLTARLEAAGLRVRRPRSVGVGDAGLALGQAWVAAQSLRTAVAAGIDLQPQGRPLAIEESAPCV
jgi:hydrogenase maturation protein HypF